jgi:hypothetical protein
MVDALTYGRFKRSGVTGTHESMTPDRTEIPGCTISHFDFPRHGGSQGRIRGSKAAGTNTGVSLDPSQ